MSGIKKKRLPMAGVLLAAALGATLVAPAPAHADPSCTGEATCVVYFADMATAYAASESKSIFDVGPADAAGLVATMPDWTTSPSGDFQGGVDFLTDPYGDHYFVSQGSGDIAMAAGWSGDAPLDSAHFTMFGWDPATNEVLVPATDFGSADPAQAMHAEVFFFVDANEARFLDPGYGGLANVTAADFQSSFLAPGVMPVSGPAGGPWTFEISDDPDDGAPEAIRGCQFTLAAATTYVKFDSSPCW